MIYSTYKYWGEQKIMEKKIFLMPLGGGQRVGASCYFLKFGASNIILDAGIGREHELIFEPDMYYLQRSSLLNSMNQVSQIFISHAHIDHIGYLLKVMKQSPNATVYMTELTAVLTKYQLYDRNFILNSKHTEEEARLAAKFLLDKVVIVNYMQTIEFGEYKVTFYPAGHIPGAMMMLFEYKNRKILYTGDFSVNGTLLTDGCYIPENQSIDTIIMCGLHAKHPYYVKNENDLVYKIDEIFKYIVLCNKNVMCHVSQLSKGMELLKMIEEKNMWNIPIYVDKMLMRLIEKMERLSIKLIEANVHMMSYKEFISIPHIVITSKREIKGLGDYKHIKIDFSLHEDFTQMKEFIKAVNPKNVYMLHCATAKNEDDDTIEQELMRDADCRAQFVFAEEQEIYQL